MIRRPPRSTQGVSSAASDVYKRQVSTQSTWEAAQEYAGEIDAPFFLVSAKTGSCVDELFRNLVQKILTQLDLSLTIRNSVKLDKNPKGAFQLTSSTKETKSKKCSCQLQPSSQPTTMSE
eukprot:TRINITY_DN23455_c0_g1_i2.p2 TRINITY_DN23455_c0_g1~~TRINITY_DN23455_c0_g1_i2.p2  ORF type:complete len:120 (+),score=21.46 TRINITY_DN23455_c0_g1_i2:129-488(+)